MGKNKFKIFDMGFPSSNFPYYLFALIVGIIIAGLIKQCNYNPGTGKPPVLDSTTSYWKNLVGDLVTSLRGAAIDFGIMEKKYKDSIAKVYKTKTRLIKEIVTGTTETTSSIPIHDTIYKEYEKPIGGCPPQIKLMRGNFKSPYYDATVQLGDSSYMNFKSYDTVALIWKRVKRELQLDISHANPDVKITGLKGYRVPDKKQKNWNVSVFAGWGYSGIRKSSFIFGLGAGRTIFRF